MLYILFGLQRRTKKFRRNVFLMCNTNKESMNIFIPLSRQEKDQNLFLCFPQGMQACIHMAHHPSALTYSYIYHQIYQQREIYIRSIIQLADNRACEVSRSALSSQIPGQIPSFSNRVQRGLLDAISILTQVDVSQHHNARQKQCSGVGQAFSHEIRSGTVHRLHERQSPGTDVPTRGQTKSTNETSTEIRNNVTIEIGHDHNIKLFRVGHKLHAGVVDNHFFVFNIWILFRDFAAAPVVVV